MVTAGRPPREPDGPLNPPIVLASTFHAGGPVGYGRYGNPTWEAFEAALGRLEEGRALAFASGMAAITAVLETVPIGALVAVTLHGYSGTLELFHHLDETGRIDLRQVDPTDVEAVRAALPGAQLLWVESPTNPLLEVVDLAAVTAAARAEGVRTVCDNTFATPLGQRPFDHGVDVVVHSATKHLSGHSDVLLGAVLTRDDAVFDAVLLQRSRRGSVPGAFEAWLALRGLRTLHLRVDRAQRSALELARRLREHPAVRRVRYPGLPEDRGHAVARRQMRGFGSLLSVELAGAAAADALSAATQLWVHTTSLGGVESTLERRRRWASESTQVPEGLVRLSVGCEAVEDLWDDLAAALDRLPS